MNLPTFTPDQRAETDHTVELVGAVSTCVHFGQNWVGDSWIGYVGLDGAPPVKGRWLSIGNQWKFITDERSAADFHLYEPLQVYDGYWGERAFIVLASLTWRRETFLAKKEWDHEHCSICWETIASHSPEYFLSNERDAVCPECYRRYVLTRSLDFIVPTSNKTVEATPLRSVPHL